MTRMAGTSRQTFRMEEGSWKLFITKCEAQGTTASDVLRHFIHKVLIGEISVEAIVPKKGLTKAEKEELIHNWLRN